MLLDSDVMIDVLRGYAPAVAWLASVRPMRLGLPGLAAMEVLQGCRNLAGQRNMEKRLQPFTRHWPTSTDSERAYQDFASYRLSHGLGLIDALIGATAVGLGETPATFNVKHFAVVVGLTTVQPY